MSAAASRTCSPPPTVDCLRDLLQYDPATGALTWRYDRGGHVKAGAAAGCIVQRGATRYRSIRIGGRACYAQCVAWAMGTGTWPEHLVAFRDGDALNLAFTNLIPATQAENQQRRTRARQDSATGVQGVHEVRRRGCTRFVAQISVGGAQRRLGSFTELEAAGQAYQDAKRLLHRLDG